MGYAMRASLGSRIKSRGLWAWRRASARYPKLAAVRRRLAAASVGSGRQPVAAPEDAADGLRPANIVWIFCVARSGSTWLASMMGEMAGTAVWKEPRVGHLFGEFYENNPKAKTESANFIMGTPTRPAWVSSIRHFVLTGARYAFPSLGPDDFLVIKEPGGGVGAPFLMEALPESRMILLVRDPRDVVSSSLDATREGSWQKEQRRAAGSGRKSLTAKRPDAVVKRSAKKYVRNMGRAREAFEAHGGPKTLVRYEDLLTDTLGAMRRVYSDLGMEVDGAALARAVEKHSWEAIPEDMKGQGKFYRKASPGGWEQDLTPTQIGIVEEISGPLLDEFYSRQNPAG
jgi:hypothetical protein